MNDPGSTDSSSELQRAPEGSGWAADRGAVTQCLERWRDGDPESFDDLLPMVYQDLRRLAASVFAGERADHTLQPTALLHDVYLELSRERNRRFANRGELFAFVATLMRRALVDHSRAKVAAKRGGGVTPQSLDEAIEVAISEPQMFVDLDEALEALAAVDPKGVELIELRFFAGLTLQEIAAEWDTSVSSLTRQWRVTRAMLRRLLEQESLS